MDTSDPIHLTSVRWTNSCLNQVNNAIPFGAGGNPPLSFFSTTNPQSGTVGVGVNINQKETSWTCGVSTLDLIKMQRHLAGIEPFTSGFQFLAGNTHRGESFTQIPTYPTGTFGEALEFGNSLCNLQSFGNFGTNSFCYENGVGLAGGSCDVILLRRLILGIIGNLNSSGYTNPFIYVPQEDSGASGFNSNPFFCVQNCFGQNGYYYDFSNDMNLNNLPNSTPPYHFFGVKLGDVNRSSPGECINFSSFNSDLAENRSSFNSDVLSNSFVNLQKENRYRLKLSTIAEEEILGFQFEIKIPKGIMIKEIKSPFINDYNYNLSSSSLKISFHCLDAKPIKVNEILTLDIITDSNFDEKVSNLEFANNELKFEWINQNSDYSDVNLEAVIQKLDDAYILIDKNPNQGSFTFSGSGFKEGEKIPFEIININGATVIKGSASNTELLNGYAIENLYPGIYILRIKTYNKTLKIIVQ